MRINVAAHQYARVNRESPISPEAVHSPFGPGEFLDRPISEYPGLAVALVFTKPDMSILLGIARPVIFKLCPQYIRQERVVLVIRPNDNTVRRRALTSQQNINRVCRLVWIPAKPQLRTRLSDRRAHQIQTALAQALRFLAPKNVIPLQRLDRIASVILHALKDDQPAMSGLDLCVLHVEVSPGVHCLDLADQELLYRLIE